MSRRYPKGQRVEDELEAQGVSWGTRFRVAHARLYERVHLRVIKNMRRIDRRRLAPRDALRAIA